LHASGEPTTTPARVACALFLLLSALYACTSSGRLRTPDERMVFFQSESLATRGSLTVPQALRAGNLFGTIDRNGEARAGYLPAQAVAAAPFYLAGQVLATLPGIPDRARGLVRALATTWSSAVLSAATIAVFFLTSWRLAGPRPAAAAAAALAFGTLLWPYAGYFFSEPLAACLLIGAAAALVTAEEVTPRRAILAGSLLGACLWVRLTHAPAVPIFVLAAALPAPRRGWRPALTVAGVVGVFLLALLAYNFALWGKPLELGYPAQSEGRLILVFTTPWWQGLFGLLLSPGKSFFLFAPPLIVAVWGLRRLWTISPRAGTIAALVPVAYLLFFMRYTQWEGGYCVGPRYLLPTMPLLGLALGPALVSARRGVRVAFVSLSVAGVLVQVTSAATSFLEDQAKALAYYDAGWGYQMGYAPLVSQGRLLWYYTTTPGPAPLGLGFDRWWIFLGRGGVDGRTLTALAAIPLGLLALSAARLRREWKRVGS
jgi:hypothetical protein